MTTALVLIEPIPPTLAKPRVEWRKYRGPALWVVMMVIVVTFAGLWQSGESERKQLRREVAEQRELAEKERLELASSIQQSQAEKARVEREKAQAISVQETHWKNEREKTLRELWVLSEQLIDSPFRFRNTPTDPAIVSSAAKLCENLGSPEALLIAGRLRLQLNERELAEKHFRAARAVFGDKEEFLKFRALTHGGLGEFRQAIYLWGKIPDESLDTHAHREHVILTQSFAQQLLADGELKLGIMFEMLALGFLQRLASEEPVFAHRQALLSCYRRVVQLKTDDPERLLRAACDYAEQMVKDFPQVAGLSHEAAYFRFALGQHLAKNAKPLQAEKEFLVAHISYTQLKVADKQSEVCTALAQLKIAGADYPSAEEWLKQAREGKVPSRELRRAECQYADATGDAMRLSALTAAWAAQPAMTAEERYELATWYARLAIAVEADKKLDAEERKKLAEGYSAEVVRQLKWVEPLDRGRFAKDPHFALLRDRADFRELVGEK